jgi:hypothetical protein
MVVVLTVILPVTMAAMLTLSLLLLDLGRRCCHCCRHWTSGSGVHHLLLGSCITCMSASNGVVTSCGHECDAASWQQVGHNDCAHVCLRADLTFVWCLEANVLCAG